MKWKYNILVALPDSTTTQIDIVCEEPMYGYQSGELKLLRFDTEENVVILNPTFIIQITEAKL